MLDAVLDADVPVAAGFVEGGVDFPGFEVSVAKDRVTIRPAHKIFEPMSDIH